MKKTIIALTLITSLLVAGNFATTAESIDTKTVSIDTEGIAKLESSISFRDVEKNYWAYDNIYALVNSNVVNGYPDGKFYPLENLTIEQFVKMSILQLGETVRQTTTGESWSAPYIEKAVELGFLNDAGSYYGKTYDQTITRLEMTYFISRVVNYLTGNETVFEGTQEQILNSIADAKALEDWQKGHLTVAYGVGILTGYPDGTFGSNKNLSRAEACTVIRRLTENDMRKPFDPANVPVGKLTPYANNNQMSVQRVDEDTINVARGKKELIGDLQTGTYTWKYTSKNFEDPEVIDAPIIGGVKRVELFDFAQNMANWLETHYNSTGVYALTGLKNFTTEMYDANTRGFAREMYLNDSYYGQTDTAYSLQVDFYKSLYGSTKLLTEVNQWPAFMRISMNNQITTDAEEYGKTFNALKGAYEFNIQFVDSYLATPEIQKDFSYAFELLFKEQATAFSNILDDFLMHDNGVRLERYKFNGRYVRLVREGNGVSIHISLLGY